MDNVMYYICYPLGYIMKWWRAAVRAHVMI